MSPVRRKVRVAIRAIERKASRDPMDILQIQNNLVQCRALYLLFRQLLVHHVHHVAKLSQKGPLSPALDTVALVGLHVIAQTAHETFCAVSDFRFLNEGV